MKEPHIETAKTYFVNYNGLYFLSSRDDEPHEMLEILSMDEFIALYNSDPRYMQEYFNVIDKNQVLATKKLDIEQESAELPFGIYTANLAPRGFFLEPTKFNFDQYLDLQSEVITQLVAHIRRFVEAKDIYARFGLLHKRGILLYGPPGNGKTMLINHLVNRYMNQAYVIRIKNLVAIDYLTKIRPLFKRKLTIFILEEITQETQSSDCNILLEFLDGPNSWDDCIIIATTNYPEMLPGNIVNRPSRFDLVLNIDNPSEAVRRRYLDEILGVYPEEIVALTKDRSLAFLKELCVQSLLNQQNIIDAYYHYDKIHHDIKTRFIPPAGEFV